MLERTETLMNADGSASNNSITVATTRDPYACRMQVHLGTSELANVLVTAEELRALLREVNPAVIRYARELTIGYDISTDMFIFHFNVGAVRARRFLDSAVFENLVGDVVYRDLSA